jgi:hypothetical protein
MLNEAIKLHSLLWQYKRIDKNLAEQNGSSGFACLLIEILGPCAQQSPEEKLSACIRPFITKGCSATCSSH